MEYIDNYIYTWVAKCFCTHERIFWCSFTMMGSNEGNKHQNNNRVLISNEGNKHQNNTRVSAETVSRCPDDILQMTIDCWRRHKYPTIVTRALDIDYIHGDIHGRSYSILSFSNIIGSFYFIVQTVFEYSMTSLWLTKCQYYSYGGGGEGRGYR